MNIKQNECLTDPLANLKYKQARRGLEAHNLYEKAVVMQVFWENMMKEYMI